PRGLHYIGEVSVDYAYRSTGLELELYLNASQWPSNVLSSQGGVRVVIHRSDSLPSPGESGFDARTGTATNVALRQIPHITRKHPQGLFHALEQMEVSRLPYPYENDCYDSWAKTGYFPGDPKLIAYDSLATMVNMCNCTCPWLQDYFTFSNGTLNGTRACNIENYDSTDNQCINDVYYELTSGNITCPCNAECQQTEYQRTISSSEWPTASYLSSAMDSMDLGTRLQTNDDTMKMEVVKVIIYFSSIAQETITESPSVTGTSLLSNLGGALSLYLGISVVMILEVIEILPLMVLAFIGRCFGVGQKPMENPPPKRRVSRRSARSGYPSHLAWDMKHF
ncbi:unnamed protein product, partial [Darwinula stevensoni]